MKITKSNNLADILFPNEENDDLVNSIMNIPPEQRRLHTETYDFTVSTLLEQFTKGDIYIPPYQRRYVWTDSQASRLVESLIIQCPIPVIYLSQDKDEKLAVIDGQQRITSLNRYISNDFPLSGLTAFSELEGYYFRELDPRFKRHIVNRTLRCMSILKETHPQVKFDVFERLNSGSARLSPQELRHGIYYGPLMNLSEKLSKIKYFKNVIKVQQTKRMKLEELVIRYFAFRYDYKNYEKPLSDFLNRFCEKNKNIDVKKIEDLEKDFSENLLKIEKVYGEYAFKLYDDSGTVISGFNSALYDAQMLSCVDIKIDKLRRLNGMPQKIMKFINDNNEFKKSISQATSDEGQVTKRINEMKQFIIREMQ